MIRAIMFDVFGTLLDMIGVPRDELRAYGDHLQQFQETGVYEPLTLPESWKEIPAFPDVAEGLRRLENRFGIYTFSNGPIELTNAALRPVGWLPGWAVNVHKAQGYKPAGWMYPWACGTICAAPAECMMVTANKDFGDIEGAAACGMQAQLIRGESDVKDMIALAERLGC